jgi:parallel beta-helix repeat protein
MIRSGFVLSGILLLTFAAFVQSSTYLVISPTNNAIGLSIVDESCNLAYTQHLEVLIESDEEFVLQGWPGNGTESNPYLINNLHITSAATSIEIQNTRVFFVVQNCLLESDVAFGEGILLYNVTNAHIQDCIITGHDRGILIRKSSNSSLLNNTVDRANRGISAKYIENCIFEDNIVRNSLDLSGTGNGHGISIIGVSFPGVALINNTAYANDDNGFTLSHAGFIILENNTSCQNGNEGYSIALSQVHLVNCWSLDNGNNGFLLSSSDFCNITQCISETNGGSGYYFSGGSETTLIDNIAVRNSKSGFSFMSSDGNKLELNNATENGLDGFVFDDSNYNILNSDMAVRNDGRGLYANWSWYLNICSFLAETNEDWGIYMYHCLCTVLNSSSANSNGAGGVYLYEGHCLNATGMNSWSNQGNGLRVYSTGDFRLTNSNISSNSENGIDLFQVHRSWIYENLVAHNLASGIIVHSGWDVEITNNTLYQNEENGFYLDHAQESHFSNNTIINSPSGGFRLYKSTSCSISNNTLFGSGFFFEPVKLEYWDYNLSGNLVNNKPVYFQSHIANIVPVLDEYGQAIFVNCSHVDILGAEFKNATAALTIAFCDNFTVFNCEFENDGISNNADDGVYLYDSCKVLLCNNTSYGNGMNGFHFWMSSDCNVENNVAYQNGINGFHFGLVSSNMVHHNNASWNSQDGFHLLQLTGASVERNVAFQNGRDGIHLHVVHGSNFTLNKIVSNQHLGVNISNGNGDIFVLNTFSSNTHGNAYDDAGAVWDDGVRNGNYWSDYSGIGDYIIEGDVGGIDHFPMQMEVFIDPTDDITHDFNTTGNYITWRARSPHPSWFQIRRNNTVIMCESWHGLNITTSIDGLDIGLYQFELTVFDEAGNNVLDFVNVQVIDRNPPIITGPTNKTLELGTNQSYISWEGNDINPDSYILYLDGEIINQGNWNGSDIQVQLIGLDLGVHNFTLCLYDRSSNFARDTVFVEVIDTISPEIEGPNDEGIYEIASENNITWNAYDLRPDYYEVWVNGTLIVSTNWTGPKIIFPISNLILGYYEITLVVFDTSENSALHTVNVKIISPPNESTPTSSTSHDHTSTTDERNGESTFFIVLIGVGGIFSAVIIWWVLQNRR